MRRLIVAVALAGALLVGLPTVAHAKAVNLHPAAPNYPVEARNMVTYLERLDGPSRWFYVDLADGSQWMVTRCKREDSNNCYWNARVRGNHKGKRFVVIDDVVHYYRPIKREVH